ncbi:MAG: iron complex transport system substrate-binding protein [Candidatus Nanohaloarchaea archaeon]|jgi:iron complex transport system substrate-binding protein
MRLISLAPSNTEILYKIDAGDQIVATTGLCDFPKEAAGKPDVGGWVNPDIDEIESYNPDLVIASDDLQDRAVENLEERGLNVLQVKPHSLGEVFDSIRLVGETVGKTSEAEDLINRMKSEIKSVDLKGERIYCEEWMNPPMVSGNWIPELIEEGGGDYFIQGGRSRDFNTGDLKKFDPGYIFLNVCGAGTRAETEKVSDREKWENIQAVEKGNVYVIDDALLNRPGPRLTEGLKQIEKRIS